MISFACPKCGSQLNIPDQYAGQVGKCTTCGSQITAPPLPAQEPDFAANLASLDIDLDSYKTPRPAPVVSRRGSDTDWILIIGWGLFGLGILTMFTRFWPVATLCWLASLALIAVDAPQRGASGGNIAKWIILTFLFWMAAFPCYLVLRNRDEDQSSTWIVLLIVALAIIGTCGGGFYVFTSELSKLSQDPEFQKTMQEIQRGIEQGQRQGQAQVPGQ